MSHFKLCLVIFAINGSLSACSDRPAETEKEKLPESSAIIVPAETAEVAATALKEAPDLLDSLNIYGRWKITRYVGGNITAITDEQAKEYTGREMLLRKDLAVILGDSCKSPSYTMHAEKSESYFYTNYKVNKSLLKIAKEEVQVVSLVCKTKPVYAKEDSPNFNFDLVIKDESTVIVAINGFFFYFEKVR